MGNIVFFDNRLVQAKEARIAVTDHGLLYGHGLFETMRVYRGRLPLADAHLQRINQSAQRLGWRLPWDNSFFNRSINQTVIANGVTDGSVRLTVTRGPCNGWQPANCHTPTLFITASHGLPYQEENYRLGIAALTYPFPKNERSPLAGIKSTSYLESILARQWARDNGTEEAILLNTAGYVAEGSMSNLFLVRNGTLTTPDLASGCLPGIARSVVLSLAADLDLPCKMRPVEPRELQDAEEIFLTNSLMEVMPLTRLNGKPVHSGRPGELTERLGRAYSRLVAGIEQNRLELSQFQGS